MAYRVVIWGTGIIGAYAIAGVDQAPDLELVGVWVSSAAKEGLDAGELAGIGPRGIITTTDADALIALKPDCILYYASSDARAAEAVGDFERMLKAGINVLASGPQLAFAPSSPEDFGGALHDIAVKAGVSFWLSGIEPGYAADTLPLSLTGLSRRVDSVHCCEIFNYATYERPEGLYPLGFGMPPEATIEIEHPGALIAIYGGAVRTIAKGIGITLDSIEQRVERAYAPEDFMTGVPIKKGDGAGCRFATVGMKDGREVVVIEHVTRMRDDIAPDWPQPSANSGCYRVIIKGDPHFKVEMEMVDDHGDLNAAACLATAMRTVNGAPAVIEAKPGHLSVYGLPLLTFRRVAA